MTNMPRSYPRSTWKREREARLGGLRQEAAHLQENLFTLLPLVPYQPGPSQSLVKNTNTFITPSFFPRSEHLARPMLFPHTALPADFYDSVYANTCLSCAVAVSAVVLNNQSSKYL